MSDIKDLRSQTLVYQEDAQRVNITNCEASAITFPQKLTSLTANNSKDMKLLVQGGFSSTVEIYSCSNVELVISAAVPMLKIERSGDVKIYIDDNIPYPQITTTLSDNIALQVQKNGVWSKDIAVPSTFISKMVEDADGIVMSTKPMLSS